MGIPSYYKKLVDSVPGLVKSSVGGKIHSFYLDFNCLIYHCLRRPSMISYKGPEHKEVYEEHLLREIVAYVKQLVAYVKPEHLVYLAVDGVVPMAKIRQQRLRRFKSVVVAKFEESIGKRDGESWDTNAITPGTAFMKKLHDRLHTLCAQQSMGGGLQWKVSSAAEPGEGEHKIMDLLRNYTHRNYTPPLNNNIVVYGLDADLIILSMLIKKHLPKDCNVYLFRESMEFGSVVYNPQNVESYHYLDIQALTTEILKNKSLWVTNHQALHDYCYSMSLLGNDFLPHSFTLHLQEHGHDRLLEMLRYVWDSTKKPLVEDTLLWNYDQLQHAFTWLSHQEELWFLKFIKKSLKERHSPFVPKNGEPWEQEYETWNRAPSRLCDVQICYDHEKDYLRKNWTDVYYSRYVGVTHQSEDQTNVLQNYFYGLQWINNYYEGRNVCKSWYFPWFVPPLWKSLAKEPVNHHWVPIVHEHPIQDYEQLMMVLPKKSWNLVPMQYKDLPKKAPQYWPPKFNYFMAGRKFMWNCEAHIPILTVHRLRSLMR